MKIPLSYNRLKQIPLFKDSFWAVSGNVIVNFLLLIAGIIIARFLGKDVYGEYGVVKTTMFYAASFASLGMAYTSTKYVADYLTNEKQLVRSIIKDILQITFITSSVFAILVFILAQPLANYMNAPTLSLAFRALGGIIICRCIGVSQIGILGGFKAYEETAVANICSGAVLLILAVPGAYFGGLSGSLIALFLSQLTLIIINHFSIKKTLKSLQDQVENHKKKELIIYSIPITLQELSYTLCHFGGIALLTNLSSVGELGLFTATAQWNAIILFIPGLLQNVVLSYLSSYSRDKSKHQKTIKLMLLINLICTFIPFIIVYALSGFIASMYGPTFSGMVSVLRIFTFITIIEACSNVFKNELISVGKTWQLFAIRLIRDLSALVFAYLLLTEYGGTEGAKFFAIASMISSIVFFFSLILYYMYRQKLVIIVSQENQ